MFGSALSRIGLLVVALIAVTAALSRCGSEPDSRLPQLSQHATIVAFGDSLTRGKGVPRDRSYPAVLARLTGRTVVNAGVSGEQTPQGRRRLPRILDQHQPELLILCHGGNDILRGRDPQIIEQNLRTMIRTARDRGVAVVLIAVPQRGIGLDSAAFYDKVAGEFQVPVETNVIPRIITDPSLKSDRIHPNAEGYRLIAEAVYELLHRSGALN